ncbi:hypothetical protein CHS0354_001082 [Potamilus streckersoni]|uniref:Uncharacterized protein n=1 Tax=Potamilus streckersoni TaxID=2493646 RepID=A0AAE0RVP5_9BIVA|nr:hypothetical protein CHS0354_001082 [Potamilus streckersoni]
MNGEMVKSDKEIVRFENEYVDNSKKELYQLHEDDNKVLNKECSKQGVYDEVSGISGSECEAAGENDKINNGINQNPDKCKVSAKSKDLLKEDKYYADVELEGSAKEINGNHYSEVSILGEKESFEQTENPVYTQPIKHVYSSLSHKWKVKTKFQSFDTSENQATDENNHTGSTYYDYVDVNVSKNTKTNDETLDATYDHLDLDRGPQRNCTNRPISDESILHKDEYDNHIISCKEDKTTVGKKDVYSKVSSRPKHDPEVDKDVSRGALERDDTNRKIYEQEKIIVEVDTNIYDSIDKSIDSLMSPDSKRTEKNENKTIELQTLTGFAISLQKQNTDMRNKYKEPYPAP